MTTGKQIYLTMSTTFPELDGVMVATGRHIDSYHSLMLGDATSINNRPAPPPINFVLTFSNGQQYTICARNPGPRLVGKAQLGDHPCAPSQGVGGDDWTADPVPFPPKAKPKAKPMKKASGKKAAKKPAGKKAAKKPAGKKAAKKPAGKKR